MINVHETYVAEAEFKLATPGLAVRCATYWAMEPSFSYSTEAQYKKLKSIYSLSKN